MDIQFDMYLDVRNQECPTPMIKVGIVAQVLDKGKVLKVIVNNEGSQKNIRNLVRNKNWELLYEVKKNDDYLFYIRREK